MSRGFASNYRIVLLALGLFGCFGSLGVRLVWLHVIDRDALLKSIRKVRDQLIVEKARRGDILDANGAILATSHSLIVLGVDPTAVRPQDDKNISPLAALIGMPETDVRRIFYTKYRAAKSSTPAVAAPPLVSINFGGSAVASSEKTSMPAAGITGVIAAAAPIDAAESDDETDFDPSLDENGRRIVRWAKLREDISEELNAEIQK